MFASNAAWWILHSESPLATIGSPSSWRSGRMCAASSSSRCRRLQTPQRSRYARRTALPECRLMQALHGESRHVSATNVVDHRVRQCRAKKLHIFACHGEGLPRRIVAHDHSRPERAVLTRVETMEVDQRQPISHRPPKPLVVVPTRSARLIPILEQAIVTDRIPIRILRTRRDRDRSFEPPWLPDSGGPDQRDHLSFEDEATGQRRPRQNVTVKQLQPLQKLECGHTNSLIVEARRHQPIMTDVAPLPRRPGAALTPRPLCSVRSARQPTGSHLLLVFPQTERYHPVRG